MRKLLVALVALAVVAVGGYFGVAALAKQRAEREVDTLLAQAAGGGTGTRGAVEVDLLRRTVTVADVSVQSAGPAFKSRQLVLAGIGLPRDGRLSAERLELADIQIDGTLAVQGGVKFTYKIPTLTLAGFSGPMKLLRRRDPAAPLDDAKLWFEQMIATTASTITIPTVTMTVAPGKAGAVGTADYTYAGVTLRDLRDGRIAEVKADKVNFTMNPGTGDTGKVTGEIGATSAKDIDLNPMLAMFDPAKAKDEYARVYGAVTVGPYAVTFEKGGSMRIESMTIAEMGLKPAKFKIADIQALLEKLPPEGAQPTPAQMRPLLEGFANLYEGMRIVDFQMRGMTMGMPDAAVKLAAFRLDKLEDGRIAELALEGLDAAPPQQPPVNIGRIALKGMHIANLMRAVGDLAGGRQPTPEQLVGLLRLIEGADLKDFDIPQPGRKKPFRAEAITLGWGAFVGVVPTNLRVTSRVSTDIPDESDPGPVKSLAATGLSKLVSNFDLGLAWSEQTNTLAATPVTWSVDKLFAASAKLSVANLPRDAITVDPLKLTLAASMIEAGPVELTLRDSGALALGIAEYAKVQGSTPEAARTELIEMVKQMATILGPLNPDIPPVVEAAAKFLAQPGSTITLKLTPKERVPIMQLIEASRQDPIVALSRFKLEATTSR